MALGDLSTLKALSIDVGSVFKMTLTPKDGIKPKNEGDSSRDKYFVIIGKTEDSVIIGSLLINSESMVTSLIRLVHSNIVSTLTNMNS